MPSDPKIILQNNAQTAKTSSGDIQTFLLSSFGHSNGKYDQFEPVSPAPLLDKLSEISATTV